jgi:hypothetical protein
MGSPRGSGGGVASFVNPKTYQQLVWADLANAVEVEEKIEEQMEEEAAAAAAAHRHRLAHQHHHHWQQQQQDAGEGDAAAGRVGGR